MPNMRFCVQVRCDESANPASCAASVAIAVGGHGAGFDSLDSLAIHVGSPVLYFDEHQTEPALPHVAQHALCRKWQVGLLADSSPGEGFLEQRCVYVELGGRPRR